MVKQMKVTLANVARRDPRYLETIFSLANGHFGSRASDPLTPSETAGTLVNGFFESSPIQYGESAYGYAQMNQTIVTLADLRQIRITDEAGQTFKTDALAEVTLDLSDAETSYTVQASTPSGHKLTVELQQLVSQEPATLTAMRYVLTPQNFSGPLFVSKNLVQPTVTVESTDPRQAQRDAELTVTSAAEGDVQSLALTTAHSHQVIHIMVKNGAQELAVTEGEPALSDWLAYVSPVEAATVQTQALTTREDVFRGESFDSLEKKAKRYWRDFWNHAEVTIYKDTKLNLAIHYNLMQLYSAAGRDGLTNIAAKGLSGRGYEGHYFWDTEMYMLPFFILTAPEVAKQLLRYRVSALPEAKKRARVLGVAKGALFAWRTISGEETSAYFPASTAQYHIDGDIAYAMNAYYQTTGDAEFLAEGGFEVILETARFWGEFGSWHQVGDTKRFEFFNVTGPDEYTALVNNNYFTNRIAKFNMALVAKLAPIVEQTKPGTLAKLGLKQAEIDELNGKAAAVYLPFNEEHQINAQDDSFFSKPVWPFDKTPKDHYPLLLHYHPLTLYRYQVDKQADTLLADYLFDDVPADQMKREYDYYESITTHDSSLSRSIFSILAARMGDTKKAYRYFTDTVRMDMTDLQGNANDGLHLANLGGSWLSIVAGFGGLRVRAGKLYLTNHLPKQWQKLQFRIVFHDRLLQVTNTATKSEVLLLEGDPLTITVDGEPRDLA